VRFPAVPTLRAAAGDAAPSWRRLVPLLLALAAIAALGVALARPRMTYQQPINEASFMLVLDHSGSMAATDVQPTRLAAAQAAANTFIDRLPSKALVGAIGFGTSPDAAQAPSADHNAARALIDSQAANGSTATGNALILALQLLHGSNRKHPPAAIVLLSDGAANSGEPVTQAAQQARQEKIPIYTIALGTPNGVLSGYDSNGFPVTVPVPPDPQLMQQIASLSGGRSFTAESASVLSAIYRALGTELGTVTRKHEVTAAFAAAGLVLLLFAAIGSTRWSARLP
jgi:Ca-activated chloride channel family protein